MKTRPAASAAELDAHTLRINHETYAAWNAHDADRVAAIFSESAVLREAGSGMEHRGRDAIRERARVLLAAFPDFRLERVVLVTDGARHADRWIMTGTHDGELFGVAPTGRSVRIEGATFTTLGDDGLVVEDVHYTDNAALAAQLGLG